MFWGLIMEPKRRYTQVVKRPFHISMASLDIFSADDQPTQVMLYFEERNYLLCTLQKGQMLQCALDLNFEMGDEVVFATNGNSNIHLSGYIQEQFDEFLDEEEEEDGEEEDEEVPETTTSKSKKKKLADNQKQPPSKKSKLAELLHVDYNSDDEDESFVPSDQAEDDDDDDDEEVEEEEEENDQDEEDENELEEEKSDASSLSDADEEEEELKKPAKQLNGDKAKSLKKKTSPKKGKEKTRSKMAEGDAQQKNVKPSKVAEQKKTLEGGVIIQDLIVGDGNVARPGKMVQVYYEGRLKQNNKVFDQSNKGAGFKFRLGKQEVIKGWDVGVAGMKIGGRRRIICPPPMAYGQKGSPPTIPPNSTLVFEVELKNIV